MNKHLSILHDLPCVVCKHLGLVQTTPTTAHHLESVRDEISDFAAVAICEEHHQGANGIHGLSRRGFENRYKLSSIDLLALTVQELQKH